MKRTIPKFFFPALILTIAVVWVGLLVIANNNRATVTSVERHPAHDITNTVNPKDCYVKATYPDGKLLIGYAETAACTYLKPGDIVVEDDGEIRKD